MELKKLLDSVCIYRAKLKHQSIRYRLGAPRQKESYFLSETKVRNGKIVYVNRIFLFIKLTINQFRTSKFKYICMKMEKDLRDDFFC